MEISITTLIENTQGEHTALSVEHGLSFLIEKGDQSVLFDTGQSKKFMDNAAKLGKDLSLVHQVVLSHGHYDHSGGFRSFVDTNNASEVTLWTGKHFFDLKYGKIGSAVQFLGNDFDEDFLVRNTITHKTVSNEITEIVSGIWVVNGFSSTYPEEVPNPRFIKRSTAGGVWKEDDFEDEVLLVVESSQGLVVIVGCAHPGILNMLNTVSKKFGKNIFALLGGTHLIEADEERLQKTLKEFQERSIEILGISHCSGPYAVEQAISLGQTNFRNSTGTTLILEG
ncbi:MBL fold metallo-hydrolase [uncultured Sphaerochaeta sp.]|uniref:MBL fold metallo-hydrolase n=1 Tax=uncultured Sphaerochaeta sp. TaxID=886478 RepID=UPI002A0A3CAF|nr:MBL fold metallo-hydrolase [uncultured Sphaerochaeta sp.]